MDWPPQSRIKTKTQLTDTAGMMHGYPYGAEISLQVIGQAILKAELLLCNLQTIDEGVCTVNLYARVVLTEFILFTPKSFKHI